VGRIGLGVLVSASSQKIPSLILSYARIKGVYNLWDFVREVGFLPLRITFADYLTVLLDFSMLISLFFEC